jgi:hypothetical protein
MITLVTDAKRDKFIGVFESLKKYGDSWTRTQMSLVILMNDWNNGQRLECKTFNEFLVKSGYKEVKFHECSVELE